MSIGKRIEECMKSAGFNKNSLAKKIGIHPSTINNWIVEKTTPDNLKLDLVCGVLGVEKKWLLTGEGNKQKYKEEVVAIHSPLVMMVPFVNQYAYAGFMTGYEKDTYLEELPKIPFMVDNEYRGTYLSFEVKGDSMSDGSNKSLESGDIILGREINPTYWTSKLHIKQWSAFIIAHRTEGIIVKQIIDQDVEKGIITCHSFNPFYEDFKINLAEVVRLYNVVKVIKSF